MRQQYLEPPAYLKRESWTETDVRVVSLGREAYESVAQRMRSFTLSRDEHSRDEVWFVEHPAVFTLGQAADYSHVLMPDNIPVVQTDRGGQVTYHGPGQLVAYPLIDLRRKQIGVRALVWAIEQAVIDVLTEIGVSAERHAGAPGIYTHEGAKISALGLRVKQMRSYHGLSLNVYMDLSPFSRINPCGYADMAVTDIHSELVHDACLSMAETQALLLDSLSRVLKLRTIS